MQNFIHKSTIPVPASDLFDWHMRPGAFERLGPPWQPVKLLERDPGGLFEGAKVTFKIGGLGPLGIKWTAEHRDIIDGEEFTDAQLSGPFDHWVHRHICAPAGEGGAVLEDNITFRLPVAFLSQWSVGPFLEGMFEPMFRFRHHRTWNDLMRHRRFAAEPARVVGISGCSGLIGNALAAYLSTGGHTVRPMVRPGREDSARLLPVGGAPITWEVGAPIDPASLEGVDTLIHLAGAPISERWTVEHKARILRSRVEGTRAIAETLAGMEGGPKTLLCASAIGYYGYDDSDRGYTEDDGSGDGFLPDVVEAWEEATRPAVEAGVRVVHLRIGIVLSPGGGALAEMLPLFKAGAGGRIGSGRQWISWIGLDDCIGAIEHVMHTPDITGPVNLTAPEPVRQLDFAEALGRALSRPTIIPAPAAAIRAVFGEMSEVVLEGVRVLPTKLEGSGFSFLSEDLETILHHELGHAPPGTLIGSEPPP